MRAFLDRYRPWMLGILRIVTALVYMEHGTQKLFRFPPQAQFGGGGRGAGGRAAGTAQSAVDTASSALHTAADAATSAMQQAADAASSALTTLASAASSMAPPAPGPGAGGMPASMQTIFLIGGLIELIGGVALVLGILTRPVAFVVAGECAVIFWWMHVSHGGIFPATNGGEAAVLFCFTFLYLVFAGPGAFAVDNLIWRRRTV